MSKQRGLPSLELGAVWYVVPMLWVCAALVGWVLLSGWPALFAGPTPASDVVLSATPVAAAPYESSDPSLPRRARSSPARAGTSALPSRPSERTDGRPKIRSAVAASARFNSSATRTPGFASPMSRRAPMRRARTRMLARPRLTCPTCDRGWPQPAPVVADLDGDAVLVGPQAHHDLGCMGVLEHIGADSRWHRARMLLINGPVVAEHRER